jgi:hypothetical protein
MSRGPGHIQRKVLDFLEQERSNGYATEIDVLEVAHWLSDVRYQWDTEPSRPQLESARRALKRLERNGRLVSAWEQDPEQFGRILPRRVYRLPDQQLQEQQ